MSQSTDAEGPVLTGGFPQTTLPQASVLSGGGYGIAVPPQVGIVQAILRTQAEVGKLGKDSFNAHGKYKFVSIDDYYEQVASVANANGLTWLGTCTGAEVIGEKSIRFDYSFTLYHSSGEKRENVFRHPVIHPIQGAQTAGSAMSYVDKLFMRHCFHVATGELDADSTAPVDTWGKPKQDDFLAGGVPPPAAIRGVVSGIKDNLPEVKVPGDDADAAQLDLIEQVFLRFADDCASETVLLRFWNENQDALKAVEKLDPRRYARVRNNFTARKEALKAQQDKRKEDF